MRKLRTPLVAVMILATPAILAAQGFRVYPGSTKYIPPNTEQSRKMQEAMAPGTVTTHYLTSDSFERVVAFYKTFARQYDMPGIPKGRKLPSGQDLKQTYFIFDGASDLSTSKSWAQVQRPFVGSMDENLQPQDVRDITVINASQKK